MSITAVVVPIAVMPIPVLVYVKIDTKETKKIQPLLVYMKGRRYGVLGMFIAVSARKQLWFSDVP